METGSDAKTFVSTELCFALQCGIRDKEMHLNIKSDTTCQDVDNHSVLQLFVTLYYKSRHFFEARNDRNVFDRQKKNISYGSVQKLQKFVLFLPFVILC